DEFRFSERHFADMSAVVADLSRRFAGTPLFLVGTSRGTVSAAALGAKFGQQASGTVLTSTVFRATGRNSKEPGPELSGFDFTSIKIPLLFVHHVSDQCAATPYSDARRLSDRYPLISVAGGLTPKQPPCEALSYHGYYGRESETIEEIVNWMLKKSFRGEIS
ncbi:MAG TPA: alpha/beta hydrolase, partial [Candidatus Binatia bacterium]